MLNAAKSKIMPNNIMKVTRKTLLIIIAILGVLLIAFGAIQHFTGFGQGEEWSRYVSDIIIVIALGLFAYNRKLSRDEKGNGDQGTMGQRE